MSTFSKKRGNRHGIESVIVGLNAAICDQRGALIGKETTEQLIGLEGLNDAGMAQATASFEQCRQIISDTGLEELIKDQIGSDDPAILDVALESAAFQLMAAGDPAAYNGAAVSKGGAPGGAIPVDVTVPGVVTGDTTGLESFHSDAFTNFSVASMIVGSLTVAQNSLDQLFFPTEVVSPSESGAVVSLDIPYVYNRTKRAGDGSKYNLVKTPLIHATEDHTILESQSTVILPRADTAVNDAFLVAAGDIANTTRVINGVEITTRPLKFGTTTDLLAVSAHPGLIGSDEQDDTDALDSAVSLGKVYFKVASTVAGATAVYEIDTDGMPGALFTRPAEGSSSALTVNYSGGLVLNSKMTSIGQVSVSEHAIHTQLGIAANDPWSINIDLSLTGDANTEQGNIKVYANGGTIGTIGANGETVAASSAEYAATVGDLTITVLGFLPKARRVNANLRMKGVHIDNGTRNTYYYPLMTGAPVSTVKPVSAQETGVSVEGMIRALRTRSSNTAITTLLDAEARIQRMQESGTTQSNASTIGSLFVKPTHVARNIDLGVSITNFRSANSYDDARSLILNEIMTVADKMALDSGYLSALENFIGADKEYEVIVGTDPRLANFLMLSGDDRTIGADKSLRVETSLDRRVRGKIFISFRRKSQSGIDALSFGAHLSKPALIHEVANASRGSATVAECQVQPQELHTVTLPILGTVTVAGLDEFYKA